MATLNRWRDLGIVALVLIVAALLLPSRFGAPDLDRTATALSVAGAAAGAALTLAVGRPNLAVGALAGVGAYISGGLALRGLNVPLAVIVAVGATAASGALIALATARLDTVGLLASTLLLAVGLAAMTQALPHQSGGQAGLGPLSPLGTSLPNGRLLHLTPTGDLHALLAVAFVVTAVAAVLLRGRVGALWRAVGSDRDRALGSGLRPLRAEMTAMSVAGALAGLGGALAAHINGVATPDVFAPDVVALPLLAALLAGRGSALGAVAAGVATALLGDLVLPALAWRGPPSASALALGLLGVAVVASLLPGAPVPRKARTTEVAAEEPWPVDGVGLRGAELVVDELAVRAGPVILIPGFSMRAEAGHIHGLVGPNGAGKSSVLAALARGPSARVQLVGDGAERPIVLQPQSGGGFPACTVDETLYLAARAGGLADGDAARAVETWRGRLGLDSVGGTLCADLSTGRRRLIDLVRVLLRRPAVLLCDEPLAGLDPGARSAAISLLRAAADAGLTIVLAEHDRAAVARLASATTELTRADLHPVLAEPAS